MGLVAASDEGSTGTADPWNNVNQQPIMILPVILSAFLLFSPGSEALTEDRGQRSTPASAEATQEEASKPPTEKNQEPSSKLYGGKLIEVEKQKTLPHKKPKFLGTSGYAPSKVEKPHLEALEPADRVTGDLFTEFNIKGRVGQQVSWFGIVRKDRFVHAGKAPEDRYHELTVEHKFFDGLTDTHQQIVSFGGCGDFKAILPFAEKKLPFKTLTLVRFYGEVTSEKNDIPTLKVKFARVWPWNNFAFMDLISKKNPDRTNKAWRKGLDIPEKIYASAPDSRYYERLLGKRKK